ncbi:MAG TPA: hypothetical protein VMT30_06690 [Candidatus Saccharimonadia bacterium]|nr:hypothetical protein [Candidatus Saccharimonadia bacterium]
MKAIPTTASSFLFFRYPRAPVVASAVLLVGLPAFSISPSFQTTSSVSQNVLSATSMLTGGASSFILTAPLALGYSNRRKKFIANIKHWRKDSPSRINHSDENELG